MPLLLALVLTFMGLLEAGGGAGSLFHGHSMRFYGNIRERDLFLCIFAVFLVVGFANELRITLKWGKEAEEFESELKEDKAEEEHRRRLHERQV
ncbi:MAG TPA: hypothetical protein VJW20_18290 [Candidatus Angelobacter sp.]|nr:hypothetical protein [Candidatus Angelobacter sp.]